MNPHLHKSLQMAMEEIDPFSHYTIQKHGMLLRKYDLFLAWQMSLIESNFRGEGRTID